MASQHPHRVRPGELPNASPKCWEYQGCLWLEEKTRLTLISFATMLPLSFLALSLPLAAVASPVRRSPGSVTLEGLTPSAHEAVKRADGTLDREALHASMKRTRSKYEQGVANALKNKKRGGSSKRAILTQNLGVDRLDDLDNDYFASLSWGTPGQQLPLMFDTGSGTLWAAADCGNCSAGPGFSPSKSSSFKDLNQPFDIQFGLGNVSGIVGQDVVSLGPFKVDQQVIGLGQSLSDNFVNSPIVGVLGMAFEGSSHDGAPSFVENLVNAKALDSNEFAFFVSRGDAEQGKAEVTIGGVNHDRFSGDLQYTPVVTQPLAFWEVQVSGLSINGNAIDSSFKSIPDTGTTAVYVPTEVAKQVWAQIPDSKLDSTDGDFGPGDAYSFPCANQDNIKLAFKFGGLDGSFDVNPVDQVTATLPDDSSRCIGAIFGMDLADPAGDNIGILGNVFLKSWYADFNFDGPRVGFAPSIHF